MIQRLRQISIRPSLSTLTRGVLYTKRSIINRRGDGVHSPYAFGVVRQVIRNPHPYSAFPQLAIEAKAKRPLLKSLHGRAITKVRVAELIFRFVHHHPQGRVLLIAPEDSLLPSYLEATGKVTHLVHQCQLPEGEPLPETIIIEDAGPCAIEMLTQVLGRLQTTEHRMVLLNKTCPEVKRQLKQWRRIARPQVSFDTLDLEIWIWRRALTAGRYTVHY